MGLKMGNTNRLAYVPMIQAKDSKKVYCTTAYVNKKYIFPISDTKTNLRPPTSLMYK